MQIVYRASAATGFWRTVDAGLTLEVLQAGIANLILLNL
jgi:hypothetical protein